MKFNEIMKEIGNDVLNESQKKTIIEAFDEAVKTKVEERTKIETDQALKMLDEDHAQKLTKLIESIDEDHTNKLKKVLVKVEEDYSTKMQEVVNKYETILKEEAVKFRDQLVSEISNYIELYIDDAIPVKQIQEAVQNTQSKKIVDELKKLVSVDEAYIKENVKEALADGKETIDNLRKELNEAVKSNIKLSTDIKKVTAEMVLEKKIAHMSSDKKTYIMRVLGDKSPEYITENFDYVIEMFERDEVEKKEVLTEQAQRQVVSKSVDTPKAEPNGDPITSPTRETSLVNEYLKELEGNK